MIVCSSRKWVAPKFKWLRLDSMAWDSKQARLTLTVNCTRWSCHFLTWAFKIFSLQTSLLMEFGSNNPISDTRFGGPNIQLVRFELSLHSLHWELRPHWVSAVHGWAGVASHLAWSLNRICLSRFLLWSSSSFDLDWTCRSYFRNSKNRSKHTT